MKLLKFLMISRAPSRGGASDSDAAAFLSAAGITDATITSAVDSLVLSLKANSLWTKFSAIYPFVGGTSATCKWNLKDPRDLDAAYRLTFSGSWSFSANGATAPNGGLGKAQTYLNMSSLSTTSGHLSCYLRTVHTTGFYITMGVYNPGDDSKAMYIAVNPASPYLVASYLGAMANFGTPLSAGYFVLTRSATNTTGFYRNGVLFESTGASPGIPRTGTFEIGNALDGFGASGDEFTFATIGSGFTAAEVGLLNTIVQNFQTALGR